MTGAYDYLLKIVIADMAEWTRITEELTGSNIGVERINTHVMMNKPKFFVGYPINEV
jgi:Lrp/AsnC family leucine-responsive transcriptional regulator